MWKGENSPNVRASLAVSIVHKLVRLAGEHYDTTGKPPQVNSKLLSRRDRDYPILEFAFRLSSCYTEYTNAIGELVTIHHTKYLLIKSLYRRFGSSHWLRIAYDYIRGMS